MSLEDLKDLTEQIRDPNRLIKDIQGKVNYFDDALTKMDNQ